MEIIRSNKLRSKIQNNDLKFGKVFTDHMLQVEFVSKKIAGGIDSLNLPISKEAGWLTPRIVPFGPLSLSPAANVLHYGVEVCVVLCCVASYCIV